MVSYARCCQPVPGDRVVGIVTIGRGVSVHRQDCPNTFGDRVPPERRVSVEWDVSLDRQVPGAAPGLRPRPQLPARRHRQGHLADLGQHPQRRGGERGPPGARRVRGRGAAPGEAAGRDARHPPGERRDPRRAPPAAVPRPRPRARRGRSDEGAGAARRARARDRGGARHGRDRPGPAGAARGGARGRRGAGGLAGAEARRAADLRRRGRGS